MTGNWRELILARVDDVAPPLSVVMGEKVAHGDHQLNPVPVDGDRAEPEDRPRLRAAAVLVPIVDHAHGPHVLLTRRADHLGQHSGQVAFPGGKIDAGETAAEAALREAEEEVGLARSYVKVAGFLDPYETGTGFRIVPVIAFVQPGFTLTISTDEVAEAFEVPLSFLMNPDNHERHSVIWRGRPREYYAMPYDGHHIWGATAGMLRNMYDRIFAPGR
ncbi:MAG: CoA pyrophosphatase [Parvibaculum sp.]